MDDAKKNLQRVIESFLSQSSKALSESSQGQLSEEELEAFADKIWELRHFAVELLESHPDESTWYNASIIKELVEQPLVIEDETKPKKSLIQAADEIKKEHRTRTLIAVVQSLNKEPTFRDILFTNLKQISLELAA